MSAPIRAPSATPSAPTPVAAYVPLNMNYAPTTLNSASTRGAPASAPSQAQSMQSLEGCMYAASGEWICNTRAAGPLNLSIYKN